MFFFAHFRYTLTAFRFSRGTSNLHARGRILSSAPSPDNHPAIQISRTARARTVGFLHSLGFKCALAVLFLRFSDLHEMLASLTHTSAYLLYVFAPLAILAVIVSGRLSRVFRERPAQFWLAFVVWMVLAVPLSSWKGGSFTHVLSYIKSNFIL